MFYIIRTLRNTHAKMIVRRGLDEQQAVRAVAEMTAMGLTVAAYSFSDDTEATMFIDPACAYFRKPANALAA